MKLVAFVCWLLFLLAPAYAQDVSPPENARIIANGPDGVVLQWPGTPKARYFVQIYTGQVAAVEQEVTGNSISVPLRAGLGYQWKVNQVKGGGYTEVVPNRGFQVVTDTQLVVSGANGAPGGLGNRRSGYVGGNGGNGGAGLNLTATLAPVGSYVSLAITGAPANRLFYFAPGSGPLILASLGGQGGPGGPGYDGRNAEFNQNTGYITLPEPGGNGGNGGDGGPGGDITVISNGLEVSRYLTFDTGGGDAGAPGPGGRGGEGADITPNWQNRRLPQGYGYGTVRAPNGYDGAPGRPGRDGQVFLR
jgi:hypothetical protein